MESIYDEIFIDDELKLLFHSESKSEWIKKFSEFVTTIFHHFESSNKTHEILKKESIKRFARGATKQKYQKMGKIFLENVEKYTKNKKFEPKKREAWYSLTLKVIETLEESKQEKKTENNEEINITQCFDYEKLNLKVEEMKNRLFEKNISSIISDRRYFLKSYSKVVVGKEMVTFLIKIGEAKDIKQALEMGNVKKNWILFFFLNYFFFIIIIFYYYFFFIFIIFYIFIFILK